MKSLVIENYEIIEKFRKMERELSELKEQYKRENKIYDTFDLKNEYYNAHKKLKEKFII